MTVAETGFSPLFIGGCPRSGTSVLAEILNTDPSCYISSEENLLLKYDAMAKPFSTRERRQRVYQTVGERAMSERETLNQSVLQYNFSIAGLWPMIQSAYTWHQCQRNGDVPLRLWGDKTPTYFSFVPRILSIEGARYLHITRHPLDTVNSMLRRTEMARQGKDWWKAFTEFDAMVAVWKEALAAVERVEAHENVLHVTYEELVFDAGPTLQRIQSFLDLDLALEDVTITDKSKHFDRGYLSDDQTDAVLQMPEVKRFLESRQGLPGYA